MLIGLCTHQLDYKVELAQDLPIGSEEIESAPRYVYSATLKTIWSW